MKFRPHVEGMEETESKPGSAKLQSSQLCHCLQRHCQFHLLTLCKASSLVLPHSLPVFIFSSHGSTVLISPVSGDTWEGAFSWDSDRADCVALGPQDNAHPMPHTSASLTWRRDTGQRHSPEQSEEGGWRADTVFSWLLPPLAEFANL